MKRRLMIMMLGVSLIFATPVMAAAPDAGEAEDVSEIGEPEPSGDAMLENINEEASKIASKEGGVDVDSEEYIPTAEEEKYRQETAVTPNLIVSPFYSSDLPQYDYDIFQLVLKNTDTGEEKFLAFDAGASITTGEFEPGNYDVEHIYYNGGTGRIVGKPAAVQKNFTVTDEGSTISLAIGTEMVHSMKEKFGENQIYIEQNVMENGTKDRNSNDYNVPVDYSKLQFDDKYLANMTDEELLYYKDYMMALGYMDDEGNLTESGEEYLANLRGEANSDEDKTENDGNASEYEDSESDSAVVSSDDVTSKEYNENSVTKEKAEKRSVADIILLILPYALFGGLCIGGILWYNKFRK